MLITSATTTNTLKYLSIQELEQYKKQFQSFWIPFMEQFIPATTIWVAGERWCNEPCPVISPCDYDFEFVEGDVSIIKTGLPRSLETPKELRYTTEFVKPEKSKVIFGSKNVAQNITKTPLITKVEDLGLSNSTQLSVNNYTVDIQSYRNRFTEVKIETI
jgi:hypothetical protein